MIWTLIAAVGHLLGHLAGLVIDAGVLIGGGGLIVVYYVALVALPLALVWQLLRLGWALVKRETTR